MNHILGIVSLGWLLLVTTGFASCSRWALAQPVAIKARGQAVVIGISEPGSEHYGDCKVKLTSCEKDAEKMKAMLSSRGFTVQILLRKEATIGALEHALEKSAEELMSGDSFVLFYAGHGGQLPDFNLDEDDCDCLDETMALYDDQFVDDHMDLCLHRFRQGVRVIIVKDSCYAAGSTRSARPCPPGGGPTVTLGGPGGVGNEEGSGVSRNIDSSDVGAIYERNMGHYALKLRQIDDGLMRIRDRTRFQARVLELAACGSNQRAIENGFGGLYTQALLYTLESKKPRTYGELHDAIRAHLRRAVQKPELREYKSLDQPGLSTSIPFTF